MSNAFDFDAGTYQGRIAGGYELGHALPGQVVTLAVGDVNAIVQTADFGTAALTRLHLRVRAPVSMPAGVSWQVIVGAGEFTYTVSVSVDRDLVTEDMALPTKALFEFGPPGYVDKVGVGLLLQGPDGVYDVELPSVLVERILLDNGSAWAVANRFPAPGDTQVPLAAPIVFNVLCPGGQSLPDVQIHVNGSEAAAFINWSLYEYNGYAAGVALVEDTGLMRWTITPPQPFAPDSDVVVRVVSASFDTTYSFHTADTVGPSIGEAVATDERAVRVTFSEQLAAVGSASDYTLVLLDGAPAVTPVVISVAQGDGTTALLELDTEQTPGAVYRLMALGLTDILGNAIVGSTATFVGFSPARPAGRDFVLYSMLLEHDRRQDESRDLKRFVGCYQEVTNLLLARADRFLERAVDPDSADEAWLDEMLHDLGNPFGFDLTIDEKRRLLGVLVAIYKLKGTDVGIINAIRFFLGLEVTIETPWIDGWRVGVGQLGVDTTVASGLMGDIYSYNIRSPIYLSSEQRSRVVAIARYMQRAPCHLRGIVEPAAPPALPDHWELGLSRLGLETVVHA